jgi:LmbE family N-acetylglucosaminyl deacetylase
MDKIARGFWYDNKVSTKLLYIIDDLARLVKEMVLIPLIVAFNLLIYRHIRGSSIKNIEELEQLSLTGIRRILIVAPHPDDETLAAAGLIQIALEMGIEIRVVVLTNGEGQRLAPLALRQNIHLRDSDFIALGERRQLETVAAMKKLGLSSECISFLGYPDRSLNHLWLQDWREEKTLRSTYTQKDFSPYATTYNPQSVYTGSNILKDLQQLINDFTPDFILIPHPNDDHPDHRAGASFVQMVVSLQRQVNPDFQPLVWAYLIHYGSYPRRRRNKNSAFLLPPRRLSKNPNQWVRLDLKPGQLDKKKQAIYQHASQVLLLGNFLPGFARGNELFTTLPFIEISPLGLSTIPLIETGLINEADINGLARDSNRNRLLGGADLLGWRVARVGNNLYLTVDTRGKLHSRLRYRILLKFSDGSTHILTSLSSEVTMKNTSLTAKINLAELPDPPVLAFAAEVTHGVTLDRSGWYFLCLQGWWD